jgi:hypothetical protein
MWDCYQNMATITYEVLPIFPLRITDVPSTAVLRWVAQISSNMADNDVQTFTAKPLGTSGKAQTSATGTAALATSKSSLERTKF